MKLIHRISSFRELSPSHPLDYGFDTTQFACDPTSNESINEALLWIELMEYRELGLLMNFQPLPDNLIFAGEPLPESWYESWESGVRIFRQQIGTRLKAIRWNHEYRPAAFASSPGFEAYLKRVNLAMWTYVVMSQKAKWLQLLDDIKTGDIHPVSFVERTTNTDWDRSTWADFRTTFRHFTRYHCERQAYVINRLNDIAGKMGLRTIVYPGGRVTSISPRLLPDLEYTLDQALLNPGVMLEAGAWRNRTTDWVQQASLSIAHPFFWTNQVGMGDDLASAIPSHEVSMRMTSPNNLGVYPVCFGMWMNWTPDYVKANRAACSEYMGKIASSIKLY